MQRRDITQTYMNACDLYIDSVKMESKGYFYIVWKRGKKVAQTLKHQSEGKTTSIKETLTLNITIQTKNGRSVEKNTIVHILDAEGRELDQITLPIHKWGMDFSHIEMPLAKGMLRGRVRRKQMMLLKNQMSVNSDVEDDDSEDMKIMLADSVGRNMTLIDSHKDQMSKIRKELEDTLYFNNKLKNDRSVLMSRNLELEAELNNLKKLMKETLEGLQKHYQSKIQIRENIYEDEINNMILSINQNYEHNANILTQLLNENSELSNNIALLRAENQAFKEENEGYQERLAEIENHREEMRNDLSSLRLQIDRLSQDNEQHLSTIEILNQTIFNLEQDAVERESLVVELNNKLQLQKSQADKHYKDLYDARQLLDQLEQECTKLREAVTELEADLEYNRNELQFTEQTWKHEKAENQQKEEVYRNHIRRLEELIQQQEGKLQDLQGKETSMSKKEEDELKTKISILQKENHRLREQIAAQESQINQLRTEAFEKHSNSEKNDSNRYLDHAGIKQRSISLDEPMLIQGDNNRLQEQNSQLRAEIQLLKEQIKKLKQQNDKLREEYDFLNDNAIKAEQHEAVLQKLQKLEADIQKLQSRQGVQKQSGEISFHIPEHKRQQMDTFDEAQKIYEDRIRDLEGQLREIMKQKDEIIKQKQAIEHKYDYLTVEMAEQQKKMEKLLIQEHEYCQSQEADQANENQFEQVDGEQEIGRSQDISFENPSIPNTPVSTKQSKQQKQNFGVKKSSTMQMALHDFERNSGRQIVEELAESTILRDGSKSSRHESNHFISRSKRIDPIKYEVPHHHHEPDPEPQQAQVPAKSIRQISRKASTNKMVRSGQISNKSPSGSSKGESYISGNTMHKFKKVTHTQKIKILEKQVEQYKLVNKEMIIVERHLKEENESLRQKFMMTQNQLKIIDEDRSTLKASLHFELAKKKNDTRIGTTQTESLRKYDQSVQVKTLDEESESFKQLHEKEIEEKTMVFKQNQSLKSKLESYSRQMEANMSRLQEAQSKWGRRQEELIELQKNAELEIKLLRPKLEEYERRIEILSKKYEQKESELERLKREWQEKERQLRNSYQELKLQKSQVEFELGTASSDVKRLKARIEELQQKVRKNDVMDILRQAQFEAETANKKIIELNRQIYQLKLEKDTTEDQMKILRKKVSDLMKKISERDDTNERHEKNLDELKRKENRLKRDLEDKEDNIEKIRDQIKRQAEQISTLKSFNTQYLFEKKKYMDDITALQHEIERRDYDNLTLKKEIERLKQKLVQKDEQRLDKKNNLRKEIEKLELMIVEKDKEIIELQAMIKQLTNRLDLISNENKRNITEKSSSYSEKLRIYVDEIADIRKVLEDNNYEISSLKQRLSEALEELDIANSNVNRLEQRLNEESETNEGLLAACENEKNESQRTKEQLLSLQYEMEGIRNSVRILRGELEREKKQHLAKKDINEELSKKNEDYLSQLNKYKIKLSDFETDTQITKNLGDKLSKNDKQLQTLMKEYRELKTNFDEYKSKYVHTPSELETSARKMEAKLREQMEGALKSLRENMEESHALEKKKLESEVVDLMNQLSRSRSQSHRKSEMLSELEIKISKLETMPMKLDQLTALYQQKCQENSKYRSFEQQNETLRDKLIRQDNNLSRETKRNQQLTVQLQESKKSNKQLKKCLQQLESQARSLNGDYSQLQARISHHMQNQKSLKSEIEKLLEINRTLQHDKDSLLRNLDDNKRDYNLKIQNLQEKLQLMSSTVKQHEKVLESHYESNIEAIKEELNESYQEIQEKERVIISLEELVKKRQNETEDYKRQLERLRIKESTEGQMLEMEFEKMRNKLAENQRTYNSNISSLEAEIVEMNKQLSRLRSKPSTKNLHSNSRTDLGDAMNSVTISRLEQKCRVKDSKIDELKQNIFILEQTIMKAKKKEVQIAELQEQLQSAQRKNLTLSQQLQRIRGELGKQKSLTLSLKTEVNDLKQEKERFKLQLEQNTLQLQSLKYELQTNQELYAELQKELEKRKIAFRERVEGQSHMMEEINLKNERISELENQLEQAKRRSLEQTEFSQKQKLKLVSLQQKISFLEAAEIKLKATASNKANSEGQHYKVQITRLREQIETLQKANKKLRDDFLSLQKENSQAKTQLSLSENSIQNLSLKIQELSSKYRDLQHSNMRFQSMNQICHRLFMMSLEEAFLKGGLEEKWEEKEFDINSLVEEVEELKFLNERKFMDFDELKKDNYELQLKLDDAEYAMDQVDELREICDKLEMEKKDALFREEAIKLQLDSLLQATSGDTRNRIEETIRRVYRTSLF